MPTNTYDLIASSVVTGNDVSSIYISGIPSTYRDLRLILTGTSTSETIFIQFNRSSSPDYDYISIQGTGGGVGIGILDNQPRFYLNESNEAGEYIAQIDIFDYAQTKNKQILSRNSFVATNGGTDLRFGAWKSSATVFSIELFFIGAATRFVAGDAVYMYGIAG